MSRKPAPNPPLIFSPRYRDGWAAGVAYCVDRIEAGDPPETVAQDALAVASAGAARFVKKRTRPRPPGGDENS